MVGQLLNLTRSRIAGGITLDKAPVDVGGVVAEVVDELRRAYPNREIRWVTSARLYASANRDRLAQVFNLIGNALKHQQPVRPVTIDFKVDGNDVTLAVHNQGPPIPPEAGQESSSRSRNVVIRSERSRGLGLELCVTDDLLRAHGGQVEVTSTLEHGTTFSVAPSPAPDAEIVAPRLVDQPQPLLRFADPGVEERRPASTRASTSTARSTSSSATSVGCRATPTASPTCTARTSTSSRGRTPTTPPAGRRCAASPTSSTCGSTRARCRSRRCTTRSRTRSGSTATTLPTSSSSTSARPAAGSTSCTCSRPRCSTGAAFKNVVSHGIVLGSDGQKMSKSLRNYPDVSEVFDRDGADAMRWFLMASPVLRGGNLVVTEEGIREGVRQVMLPLWSTWYFFSLYAQHRATARAATRRPRAPTRPTCSTGTCSRSSRDLVTAVTDDFEDFDSTARRAAAPRLRRRAHQLVRAPLARPVLGGRRRGRLAAARRSTRSSPCSRRSRASRRRCCRSSPSRSGGASPADAACTWPTGPTPRSSRPTTPSSPRWTRCARSAVAVLALRKQAGRRVRLPLASLTVVATDAAALAPFEAHPARRAQREVRRARDARRVERRARTASPSGSASTRAPRAAARQVRAAGDPGRAGRATGRVEGDGVVAGGIALERGRVRPRARGRRLGRRIERARAARRRRAS